MSATQSDETIERAWRTGLAGAFAELFHRHYRGVVAYVAGMTRDLAAAEDVAQQAFVRILERREGSGRFQALVYTVARNLALNELRRRGRRYVARTGGGAGDDAPGRAEAPLEGLVAAEEARLLERALAALAADEREAFTLKETRGMTYAEAGEVMGLHPDAVRRRVARAYERLRAALGALEVP